MPDKFDEKAPSLCEWCAGETVGCVYCAKIATFGRSCAQEARAAAFREAQNVLLRMAEDCDYDSQSRSYKKCSDEMDRIARAAEGGEK